MSYSAQPAGKGRVSAAIRSMLSPRSQRPVVLKPYSGEQRPLLVRLLKMGLWASLPLILFVYGFAYALTTPWLILQFAAPLVVLALLVIWALPDSRYAPTGAMEGMFFAFFAALIAWPNYVALNLPGMPWITIQRLLGFPLLFLLLISVSISRDVRRQMAETLSAGPAVWKLMVAFVVLDVIALVVGGMEATNGLIVHQVSWTSIFFVSCYVFLKPGRAERWAVFAWVLALVVGAIGVDEYLHGKVPWAGHLPSFLGTDNNPLVQKILAGAVRDGTDKYRVQSTFTTSLGLAEYFALAVPFIIHFIAGRYNFVVKVLAGLTLPFLLFVVFTTDSRLGVIGFLLSFLLYLLLWGAERWRRLKGDLIGPAITLAYPAIFTLAIASTLFVGRIRRKVWGDGSQNSSNQGREHQYQIAFEKLLERPWGYGTEHAAGIAGSVTESGVLTIDTYYVVIALNYGVVGFFVYYTMFVIPIVMSGRFALSGALWRDRELSLLMPVAVSLTNYVVIKSVFSNPDNHPMAFMMLGMALALVARVRKLSVDVPPAPLENTTPARTRRLIKPPKRAKALAK
jgi:hypothetical protein